jgi:hypothetical protein
MTMPPASLTLWDEEERFYGALGKAVTQWQEVEQALAMIFLDAHTQSTRLRANVIFHTVLSFETRLDMVDAALKASRGTKFLAKWQTLFNRCSKRARRRNQLAHFGLMVDPKRRPGYRYHLRPSIFDLSGLYKRRRRPPELNTCQIIAVGNSFSTLAQELQALLRPLPRDALAQLLASREPKARRPPRSQNEDAPNE